MGGCVFFFFMELLTPSQINQPRLVTLTELRTRLLPICQGWKWAEDAIADLWKLGAPIPGNPNEEERRVLLPGQFSKWWQEVAERMGYAQDGPLAYRDLSQVFRSSAGMTRHPRHANGEWR